MEDRLSISLQELYTEAGHQKYSMLFIISETIKI